MPTKRFSGNAKDRKTERRVAASHDEARRVGPSVLIAVATAFAVEVLATALKLSRAVASREAVLVDIVVLPLVRILVVGPTLFLRSGLALGARPLQFVAVRLVTLTLILTSRLATLTLHLGISVLRLSPTAL